ncbi:hypothetical protein [Hymenobacter canadensis]|uniref:STAS/SEC14 domain-containing protein n=1 Tax=Hymenobacter canadensis TaxID=2999067 RepID=A0ABY7LKR3_9BACT|nr:hypothetical protein [Hymenobacter canadensis]WBA41027.1 hypothetical protein O3303_14510 [Hymenobacter canadensis]
MQDFSTPDFPILYRPDLDILVGRWLVEISLAEEVKQNYVQLFQAAAAANCRFWLLDARRRFRTTHEITNWVNQNAPRQALEKLGREIRVAFLLAPHQLLASTDSSPFPELRHPDTGHAMSAQFTDEGEAIAWLQAEQSKV